MSLALSKAKGASEETSTVSPAAEGGAFEEAADEACRAAKSGNTTAFRTALRAAVFALMED